MQRIPRAQVAPYPLRARLALKTRIPRAQVAPLLSAQAESLLSQRPFKQTFCFDDVRAGRRWLHCEALARPLPGGRVAWSGYVVDVSTERALQARLLDEVQAKNLFVASASHALRAPLQAITLALARLGEGLLDAEQRAGWQVAQQASGALVQLIDDVLDLARFETGRVRLQPTPVALAALLGQIIEQHRFAADDRGLALSLHLAPDLPEQAQLDALRLRQLLANLIGNALKYTRQGSVTVRAGLDGGAAAVPATAAAPLPATAAATTAAPAIAGWLRVSVQDTGIGIAPEQVLLLFEPFGVLQSGIDANEPGTERRTGLGLAICKRLVQAMQGEITLASAPGVGTEVVLRLPLPTTPAARAGVPAPAQPPPAPPARHGTVLSDRHRPGGDGLALLQQISAEAAASGRRCPSRLLCTGDAGDACAAAAETVLAKPVSVAGLAGALAALGVLPGAPPQVPPDAAPAR